MSNYSRDLQLELLNFLSAYDQGVPDDKISNHFGARYPDLVPVINDLIRANRLQLYTQGANGVPMYRAIKESTASKLDGLGREQIMVYQVVEKAGDRGIWKQDIRFSTSIPQQALDRILKLLEQRLLIKTVRSIGSKTKKLYMLYDVQPAKEITGGPWYTDQEFDHEYVETLCTFILQFIQQQKITDLPSISMHIKKSGISTIDLSESDLQLVLQTLVYDNEIEEVSKSVLQLTSQSTVVADTQYKISVPITIPNYLTDVPCGVCPVTSQCCVGGVISPESCEYMTEWLKLTSTSTDMTW